MSTPPPYTPRSGVSADFQVPPSKFDLPTNIQPRLPSVARPTSAMLSRTTPRLSMCGEMVTAPEPIILSPHSSGATATNPRRPSSAVRPHTPRRDTSFQTDLTLLSVHSTRSIVVEAADSPSQVAVVTEQPLSRRQRDRDYQVQKLAECMTEQVRQLHFSRFLSPRGVDHLCEALHNRASQGVGRKREEKKDYRPYPLPLDTLSFRACGLTAPTDQMCSLLASSFLPALHTLDLHGNPLGAAGLQLLARAVRGLSALRTVVLSHCSLDASAIDPVYDLLRVCPTVTDLSLCENNLWSVGVSDLFQSLSSASAPALRILRLKFVGADAACVDAVCDRLRRDAVPLQELDLKGNFFSETDGKVRGE